MELIYPAYYQHFSCLASACPDSCCKEWEVDVDATAAAYYRSLPGDLGERLRAVLRQEGDNTLMTIENGRCPMWQQDGLCRIHAQLGHDALCQTCRDYPRLRHDYGDFVELGLELSCPEAARLIFSPAQKLSIQELPGGEAPEYDPEAMQTLKRSRNDFLDFLEHSTFSMGEALAILLLYGYGVQNELDGGEQIPLSPEDCLQAAKSHAGSGDLDSIITFFSGLEILTDRWNERLSIAPCSPTWQDSLRYLIRYFIQRYWLQAVSDYDLICRVKFIVISCILICALGGDLIQTAQLYSKEIENDLDNIEAILDGAYTAQAFTDRNLLGLLL